MRARMRDACSHFFKSYASNDARNAYLKIRCADTSEKNIGENVLPVIVHERMGTVFEISGKIGHSGTILYRVPNVWEWPYRISQLLFHRK